MRSLSVMQGHSSARAGLSFPRSRGRLEVKAFTSSTLDTFHKIRRLTGSKNGTDVSQERRDAIQSLVRQLEGAADPSLTTKLENLPLAGTTWDLVYSTVKTTSAGMFGPYGPIGPFVGRVQQIFEPGSNLYRNRCSFLGGLLFIEVLGRHFREGPNTMRVRFEGISVHVAGLRVLNFPFKEEDNKGGLWRCTFGSMEEGVRVLYSDRDNVFILVKEGSPAANIVLEAELDKQ